MLGKTVGNYRVTEKLGEGGMGIVYLAKDLRLGRNVALKVLPAELARDPDRVKRFEREARAASALNHPNVAHIYDVGSDGGLHFIAMEHVVGEDLAGPLSRGALDVNRVLRFGIQIADALAEAHANGIVHRDVKPGNIMVTESGRIKVLDFGLAKQNLVLDEDNDSQLVTQTRTEAGVVMGTVRYMSPEQALGRNVDARSDVFSLGVVLYELATGKAPFAGSSATETIDQILHAEPEPFPGENDPVRSELFRIVQKCLEKDRELRYRSGEEVAAALGELERIVASGSLPARVSAGKRTPMSFGRWVAIAAGGVAVATVIVLGSRFLPTTNASIDSIAVLPFENETGDREADYLSDGISENLINTLSRVPDLRVISRASAFVYKDRKLDIGEIGRELDVDAVLVGRMVQRGEDLSIRAELVDVRNKEQIWGERYQRTLREAQSIEQEIAETITATLARELAEDVGRTPAASASRGSGDPMAYQLYLKGRHFIVGSDEEMERGADAFREAIERDPDYALAYAGLAEAHLLQAFHGGSRRDEALFQAKLALEKAFELDPSLPETHTVSGMVKFYFEWDWRGAEAEYRRAIELNPGSAVAYVEYTTYLLGLGRFDEAIAAARRAEELDPVSTLSLHELAFSYLAAHQYEAAATQFLKAIEIHPSWMWGHLKLSMTYVHEGRSKEALAELAEGERLLGTDDNSLALGWSAFVHARAGEEGRAREILARMLEDRDKRHIDATSLAIVYAGLGDVDGTLSWLETGYREKAPLMIYLKVIPAVFLVDLDDEPRYRDLLERMALS